MDVRIRMVLREGDKPRLSRMLSQSGGVSAAEQDDSRAQKFHARGKNKAWKRRACVTRCGLCARRQGWGRRSIFGKGKDTGNVLERLVENLLRILTRGVISESGKKLAGRLPLSDRPFAFLVTPKLPLGGRSEKSMLQREEIFWVPVNRNFEKNGC